MAIGRPLAPLTLTAEEREALQNWSRRPKTAQALAQRSRLVLAGAEGRSNTAVARKLGVSEQMVTKWRAWFGERRLDGLLDKPRPGGAPAGERRGGGKNPGAHPGEHSAGRHALEHPGHG